MGFPQDFDLSDEDEQTWQQIQAELVAEEEAKRQQAEQQKQESGDDDES